MAEPITPEDVETARRRYWPAPVPCPLCYSDALRYPDGRHARHDDGRFCCARCGVLFDDDPRATLRAHGVEL